MLELQVYDSGLSVTLKFEHSLLSVSKWEEEYKTPFLTANKTAEQLVNYFRYMLLSPEDSEDLVFRLAPEQLEALTNYVNESRTASSVPRDGKKSEEIVTSELIYYWLTKLKIPYEPTNTWHLSRVMMLVEMTTFKDQPPKKQRQGEFMDKFRAANAARKKQFNSNG